MLFPMKSSIREKCGVVSSARSAGPTPTNAASASTASCAAGELAAWLARYEPVEREIMEARERRLAGRVRRDAECREADARAFGDLCEATEGFAVVWRREGWSARDMVAWADGDAWTLLTLARWLRREATREIDALEGALRRPFYYARENARRRALAEERRRISRRSTTSPCPTREQVLEAWTRRRDSHEAAVRFGSMVHDLECYVDNSLLRDEDGVIVGRRGGVKAWLQENIPALYVRYATVMRYKAMAKKLRQVTGLSDPTPAAAVLSARDETGGADAMQDYGADEILLNKQNVSGRTGGADGSAAGRAGGERNATGSPPGTSGGDGSSAEIVRARAVWQEVTRGMKGRPTALMARIDALLDPGRVTDANMLAAWRTKYMNEITVRTKEMRRTNGIRSPCVS